LRMSSRRSLCIRVAPIVDAQLSGWTLKSGEVFETVDHIVGQDGTEFLALADGRGWIPGCTKGVFFDRKALLPQPLAAQKTPLQQDAKMPVAYRPPAVQLESPEPLPAKQMPRRADVAPPTASAGRAKRARLTGEMPAQELAKVPGRSQPLGSTGTSAEKENTAAPSVSTMGRAHSVQGAVQERSVATTKLTGRDSVALWEAVWSGTKAKATKPKNACDPMRVAARRGQLMSKPGDSSRDPIPKSDVSNPHMVACTAGNPSKHSCAPGLQKPCVEANIGQPKPIPLLRCSRKTKESQWRSGISPQTFKPSRRSSFVHSSMRRARRSLVGTRACTSMMGCVVPAVRDCENDKSGPLKRCMRKTRQSMCHARPAELITKPAPIALVKSVIQLARRSLASKVGPLKRCKQKTRHSMWQGGKSSITHQRSRRSSFVHSMFQRARHSVAGQKVVGSSIGRLTRCAKKTRQSMWRAGPTHILKR